MSIRQCMLCIRAHISLIYDCCRVGFVVEEVVAVVDEE